MPAGSITLAWPANMAFYCVRCQVSNRAANPAVKPVLRLSDPQTSVAAACEEDN
jgi:hypothetical protein